MEYIGGGDLQKKVKEYFDKRTYLSEKRIWLYFLQCLIGLKHLHNNKIIHRDIKTANIFLSEDEKTIKLGDLNVSKIVKNELAQT